VEPRRLVVLRGTPEDTRRRAELVVGALTEVAWGNAPLGTDADAVVVSLHDGFDPEALGRAVGLVRGGGALVLCVPPQGPPPSAGLAVWPHGPDAVGTHLRDRLLRSLPAEDDDRVLPPSRFRPTGNAGQLDVIAALQGSPPGARHVVLGGRGRGKSAAIGTAARALPGTTVVTSLAPEHAATVLAFAPGVRWVEPAVLACGGEQVDTLIVDEASALPVPLLNRLVAAHPHARRWFATTVHGYEGTGRGFVHRFLPALRRGGAVQEHVLTRPIRWAEGDPLEAWADRVLLLDAVRTPVPVTSEVSCSLVDRAALAGDEALLRDVFGLLVEAHYRTTPGDLGRLLDAPNLGLHAARAGGRVVGVALVAQEGGLPTALVDGLARGVRLRGHALPETLVSHAGAAAAGALQWVRSVRLATDEGWRGRGVATALVAHVESTHAPDGFGTLFGATPELLRFRRGLGYVPVRLSASRGARSGEPSVVLVKPRSPEAAALVATLRADLARDLPAQLALCAIDGGFPLDPALVDLLTAELPPAAPVDVAGVAAFLAGRPYEAAVTAVEALVAASDLGALDTDERGLVVGRVVERRAWAALAGTPERIPATMRAFRRAIARLASGLEGPLQRPER
jgi:tRNA(Met) cytidine acetyltransferase